MPFQSYDQIVSSLTGDKTWQTYFSKYIAASPTVSLWYDYSMLGGEPVANTYAGSNLTAIQMNDSSEGAMYHGGNVSPSTKHIVDWILSGATGVGNVFLLCDYLLYYRYINLNTTSQQNLTNSVGLPRYTDGKGVRAFFVTTTAAGATAALLTISYTNQDGVSGRTLPVNVSMVPSSPVNHITHSGTGAGRYGPFLPLAEGDTGIRSVEWVKLNKAMGSGYAALVLVKPLIDITIPQAYVLGERECIKELPSLPRIYDGAYLGVLVFHNSLSYQTMVTGFLNLAWD
jgi:hypothetical protein